MRDWWQPVAWWWDWHVRVNLCCMGVLACPGHRRKGEIDATWLRIRLDGPWTV